MLTSDLLVHAHVHKYPHTSMHMSTHAHTERQRQERDSAVYLGDTFIGENGHAHTSNRYHL